MSCCNFFKCNEAQLLEHILNSYKGKCEILCEAGDRKLILLSKRLNKNLDSSGLLDLNKNGSICKNSIPVKKPNRYIIFLNTENATTKIHIDISSILTISELRLSSLLLFVDNFDMKYLNNLIKTIYKFSKDIGKNGNSVFILCKEIDVCITFNANKISLSNMHKTLPNCCLKKTEAVECINKYNIKTMIMDNEKLINLKKEFISLMSKYFKIIPHQIYLDTYSESHRFISIVIFDNKVINKWLVFSIINTNIFMPSSKLGITPFNDKTISYTMSLDKYIKAGFCRIDISQYNSLNKLNLLVKNIIKSIEIIYPAVSFLMIRQPQRSTPATSTNNKKSKKVKFNCKIYSDDKKNKPDFNVKMYKNGKPVGILKKKSSYR